MSPAERQARQQGQEDALRAAKAVLDRMAHVGADNIYREICIAVAGTDVDAPSDRTITELPGGGFSVTFVPKEKL